MPMLSVLQECNTHASRPTTDSVLLQLLLTPPPTQPTDPAARLGAAPVPICRVPWHAVVPGPAQRAREGTGWKSVRGYAGGACAAHDFPAAVASPTICWGLWVTRAPNQPLQPNPLSIAGGVAHRPECAFLAHQILHQPAELQGAPRYERIQ